MTTHLDLHDIQGNIVKGYGRYGFPLARYVFLRVNRPLAGQYFVLAIGQYITSAVNWNDAGVEVPEATTNIAFTYAGLKNLGIPTQSLQSFPEEFAMGMKARRDILGDDDVSAPSHWDPIWCSEEPVHIWISINARTKATLESRYQEIVALVADSEGGVEQLAGHRGDDGAEDLPYQDAAAILSEAGTPTPKEHFGYTDGISNPFFKGCGSDPENVIGGGKPTRGDPATMAGWAPLETGEFILGYRDEALEYPKAPIPRLLSYNGTFMVFRKLHENVGAFNRYLGNTGKDFPGGEAALAAKFAGRWRNGAPLALFPNEADAEAFERKLTEAKMALRNAGNEQEKQAAKQAYLKLRTQSVGFNFNDDLDGSACPLAAHTRRTNPRGSLEFGEDAYNTPGALVNRRRILRRGLPYGQVKDGDRDDGNHGIIFMSLNADIKRQFEFVQQQWMNYGNDFKQANDKDPILGNHSVDKSGQANGRMIIQAKADSDKPPFFCSRIPRLVETRGGDYFFIPSITALRMIGEGIIDPT